MCMCAVVQLQVFKQMQDSLENKQCDGQVDILLATQY